MLYMDPHLFRTSWVFLCHLLWNCKPRWVDRRMVEINATRTTRPDRMRWSVEDRMPLKAGSPAVDSWWLGGLPRPMELSGYEWMFWAPTWAPLSSWPFHWECDTFCIWEAYGGLILFDPSRVDSEVATRVRLHLSQASWVVFRSREPSEHSMMPWSHPQTWQIGLRFLADQLTPESHPNWAWHFPDGGRVWN